MLYCTITWEANFNGWAFNKNVILISLEENWYENINSLKKVPNDFWITNKFPSMIVQMIKEKIKENKEPSQDNKENKTASPKAKSKIEEKIEDLNNI